MVLSSFSIRGIRSDEWMVSEMIIVWVLWVLAGIGFAFMLGILAVSIRDYVMIKRRNRINQKWLDAAPRSWDEIVERMEQQGDL